MKGPEASIAIDIPPPKNAGGIKLIFDAVVTTAPSKIDVWLIQNGVRNLLTQINLSPNWSSYQIEILRGQGLRYDRLLPRLHDAARLG